MKTFFEPIYLEPAKHFYKIIAEDEYRTYWLLANKLRKISRFTACHASVRDWKLSIPDSASFLSAYKEIFVERIYDFKFDGDEPRILDLGANIGLSVLFFKRLYPKAKITAFEADPEIFAYLEKNVHGNGYHDVQLMNTAAWYENTKLKFHSEGADGGRAAEAGDKNLIEVSAIDMREFLQGQRFDFLKMDIEGAEEFVLPACREHLADCKYVFVEYHSRIGREQCLDKLIGVLSEAGFRIHIHSPMHSPSPFREINVNAGFDLQLNIFGKRE